MAVNVPNTSVYTSQLGQHCTAFRDALQALLNDAAYLNAMGGTSFLETTLGIDATDAQEIVNVVGAVTPSNTTVQAIQGWINSTEFLWGGQ